ncbi:PEP-CTERM sorting domain-containing protein [Intestinicryptomonas porci]|uniref:PEP-CTERM sorting domain-containing protein n=1 Tax=Intestinicryptomonas porci TaxID=2926320 RepID=A0ABU4WDP2_9BACT|nr:PEP-CTERM sorting domain-containing protein [Opitutales bacterium CLA-KB-P66]
MKTKRYLYSIAASALFLSGAYAADTELVLDASQDGLTWADALWSNGTPQEGITALINIADSENPLLIQGEAVAGKLNVYNNSYLLLTGEGNSLKTTITEAPYGNIEIYNNSKFVVSDKASLTIANGMSVYVNDNASFEVNNATFTGKFYNKANNVVIQNGSTWNATGYHNGIKDANILVKDSTINSTTGFQMGSGQTAGHSKVLTLENSDWKFGGNGANFCGIVNILDSSITSTGHINMAAEGGNASGENLLYMKGSSAKSLSTMTTYKLWWNTNGGDTSTTLHQAGNTNVTISNAFDSSNNTNGGSNVLWLFSGDNNTAQSSADSSWGDNGKNKNTTGIWKITNAQTVEGIQTTSTNSLFKTNSIYLKVSSVEDNNFQSVVDWAGTGNTFKTSYDVFPCLSTGANTNAVSSFTVRDGALADIGAFVVVGGKVDASLSGTASFNVLNGATYNQKSHIVLQNSTVAGSTGRSEFNFENANWNRTNGSLLIGFGSNSRTENPNQDAISGTSIATIKDSIITYGGNVALAGSKIDLSESGTTHSNVAKLVIDDTKFTFNGELYLGHIGYNGGTIYGGTSIIEVIGENSAFISSNKGLYSGYNTTTYGGARKILVSGKNNTVSFGSNGAFYMNSAGGAKQYGGSFEVNIQGEGHTFQTGNNIDIGMKDAVGGSNTFYVKGTSSANKNKVLVNGGNIYIKASSDQKSTIVNTMELAGNTILSKNSDGERINFNLSSSDTAVAGAAKFIISGENNEVYLNNLSVGRTDLDSGSVLLQIEGSTHNISAVNFAMRTSGLNTQAATLSFVSDSVGISTLKTTSVNELSGFIDVDFSKYVAQTTDPMQFILISAENNWDGSNYETDSENEYIKVSLANENDTWRTFMEGNNLVLEYNSAVIPEPSTFAAIFGAIALAFAAYRRKKQ